MDTPARCHRLRPAARNLTAAALVLGCITAAGAQDAWPVKGKLFGKGNDISHDVSGIACFPASGLPRSCLLVDDESQGAQIVIVKEREIIAGKVIGLIEDVDDKGRPISLDGEGVAFADGFFYVIGSHGHPRDRDKKLDPVKDADKIAAEIKASSRVIRVRIDPAAITPDGNLTGEADIKLSAELGKLLAAQPELAPFAGKRLDENGLTVEGIAVRDGRLYAGMRAPSLQRGTRAAILSVSVAALFDGAAPDPTLHVIDLGPGRGVRDLVTVDDGFLVIAGPSADVAGTYAIYAWDGRNTSRFLTALPDLTVDGRQIKPEALLPLGRGVPEGLRVLVWFDGGSEGAPRPIRIPHP
jgi:hypothetical protein